MTPTPDSLVLDLAGRVLNQDLLGRTHEAAALIRQIAGYGDQAVEIAIRSWCDTLINAMRADAGIPPTDPITLAVPVWPDEVTGQPMDPHEVSPHLRWAGQLIAARIIADYQMYMALVASLPDDPDERDTWLGALATVCSPSPGTKAAR